MPKIGSRIYFYSNDDFIEDGYIVSKDRRHIWTREGEYKERMVYKLCNGAFVYRDKSSGTYIEIPRDCDY